MDSRLASLVHESNEPLDESQARDVRLILADTLASLADLDHKISDAPLSLVKLEQERSLRASSVAALKGALSPIHIIPPEILGEIFLLCRNTSLESSDYSIADPLQAPVVLTHVSYRWRQVGLGDPRLWDHFHLSTQSDSRLTTASLQSILARSRNTPLHVNLGPQFSTAFEQRYGVCDLKLLFQEHHRLKHIHCPFHVFDFPIVRKRTFEILSSIEVYANRVLHPHVGVHFFKKVIKNAPQLRNMTLRSDFGPHKLLPSIRRFPWSQLSHLSLQICAGLAKVRDILAHCKMIELFEVWSMTYYSDHLDPLPRVHRLKHLRRLVIDFEQYDAPKIQTFFEAFSLPALVELNIRGGYFSAQVLPNLHAQSQFALETLELSSTGLSAGDLILFLRCLRSLQNLVLKYCCVKDALFTAFTSPQELVPSFSLPKLRLLSICSASHYERVHGASIADMAEAVCAPSEAHTTAFPNLSTVFLHIWGSRFDDEVEARLAAACAIGRVTDYKPRVHN